MTDVGLETEILINYPHSSFRGAVPILEDLKILCMTTETLYTFFLAVLSPLFPTFFLFWPCWVARGILVSLPWIKLVPLAVEVWSPNHWGSLSLTYKRLSESTFTLSENIAITCLITVCSYMFYV